MTSALNHKWKKRSATRDVCERCKLLRRRKARKMRNRRDAPGLSEKTALAHRRTVSVIEYSVDGKTWQEGFVYCRGAHAAR